VCLVLASSLLVCLVLASSLLVCLVSFKLLRGAVTLLQQ
jgi:hypothetical protein